MKSPRRNLVGRLNERAAQKMLVEFANTRAESRAFERFKTYWQRFGLKWVGGEETFRSSQGLVRKIWEGKTLGIEGGQVAISLGLYPSRNEKGELVVSKRPPIDVDWEHGRLAAAPRDLYDLIWLTLLKESRLLGICANKEGDAPCQTPYFLKYRAKHRFCSDACAKPAQRAAKRRWWKEHGEEWLRRQRR